MATGSDKEVQLQMVHCMWNNHSRVDQDHELVLLTGLIIYFALCVSGPGGECSINFINFMWEKKSGKVGQG